MNSHHNGIVAGWVVHCFPSVALWINRQVCVTCQYQYVIRMHCGNQSDFLHNLFEISQGRSYASGLAANLNMFHTLRHL